MSIGMKGNVDGSGAIQVGGSDAITISTGLNATFAGTVTSTGVITSPTGALYPLVSGTAVASTSGTSIDFTGIPSTAKRITVMFSGVSTVAANDFLIQLGTGAGPTFTTSGYVSSSGSNSGTGAAASTAGLLVFNPNAGSAYYGPITLTLVDAATFKWVEGHTLARSDNQGLNVCGGGGVTLSALLTAIRITTIAGTTTFDAGSINIMWE